MTDTGSPFLGNTGIIPGSPEPGGFFGPYRGLVTNTTDPAAQNRIKAIVPQLFGDTSTETDWALPCQLPGLQSTPSPGQGVWIMFEGGDINYPVYVGMWQAEPSVAPYDAAGAAAGALQTAETYAAQQAATAQANAEAYTNAQLAVPPPGTALSTYVFAPLLVSSYNLTGTLTALDTTNLTLGFVVPSNGIVDFDVTLWMQIVTGGVGGCDISLGLFKHGTTSQTGYTTLGLGWGAASVAGGIGYTRTRFHLTGLAPGSLQIDVAAGASDLAAPGNSAVIAAQGYAGNPNGSNASPALLQAFASV